MCPIELVFRSTPFIMVRNLCVPQPEHLHKVTHLKEPIMHLDVVAHWLGARPGKGGEGTEGREGCSAMAPISGFLCMITSQLVNQ